MIHYRKGSLFDAPPMSIIAHACNTEGVWGAGIAAQFAKRYPMAEKLYSEECKSGGAYLGACLLIPTDKHIIACLYTASLSKGQNRGAKESILWHTKESIKELLRRNTCDFPIHMCKINSGIFNVPWEETEKVLNEFNHDFTVWEISCQNSSC